MKKTVRKEFVLAVGSCLIAMLISGCEEQNLSTARRDRLITYENKQLKEQLAQQEKEVEEQSRLLGECQQKKGVLENRLKEEVDTRASKAREFFGRLSERLRQENDQLKAQVKGLQAEASKLEQELRDIKSPEEPQPLTP